MVAVVTNIRYAANTLSKCKHTVQWLTLYSSINQLNIRIISIRMSHWSVRTIVGYFSWCQGMVCRARKISSIFFRSILYKFLIIGAIPWEPHSLWHTQYWEERDLPVQHWLRWLTRPGATKDLNDDILQTGTFMWQKKRFKDYSKQIF